MKLEDPIKLEIPPEEKASSKEDSSSREEVPFVPESSKTTVSGAASQAGQAVTGVARKAWESDTRRKVTRKVGNGLNTAVRKGTKIVSDKVSEVAERQAQERVTAVRARIEETDWQQEAKNGLATGLNWLSERLAILATKVLPSEKPPN